MEREYSAGGVVSRGEKLLLVKVCNLEGKKVWTFPKGHLEKGETPLEAALREVEEETGWRCRKVKSLLVVRYNFLRKGRPVAKRVRWYWLEPLQKAGKPDAEEILKTRWLTPEAAAGKLSYRSDLKLLKAFLMVRGAL
jgi:ADP-ribose pyrophosphatase YjhB (NUDIX family)